MCRSCIRRVNEPKSLQFPQKAISFTKTKKHTQRVVLELPLQSLVPIVGALAAEEVGVPSQSRKLHSRGGEISRGGNGGVVSLVFYERMGELLSKIKAL